VSRTLSLTARQAVFSQETDQVFLLLLTIAHPDMAVPVRVVNNLEAVTSRGNEFIAFPFQINLPYDKDDQITQVTLTIDNVDQQIVVGVRALSSPPTVTLEVVLAASPDTVEAGPFDFSMKSATYDSLVVEGVLGFEDILNEPFPGNAFTPQNFPGMF